MKSTQRRKEILEVIEAHGGISVGELAERFGVSRMTGHRDLQHLESRGVIKRIFGGAVPAGDHRSAAVDTPMVEARPSRAEHCVVCQRAPAPNLAYVLTLGSGEQRHACCPHCGVSAQLVLRSDVSRAVTSDYLTGRAHPVGESFFVMGSAAAPCCHPSMLTFENEDMAYRFQVGFGGTVGRYGDAVRFLQEAMSSDEACPNCRSGA